MILESQELSQRIDRLKEGDSFRCINDVSGTFILDQIITKQSGKKLKDPLYVWKYTDSEKTFTNRVEDIRRAFLYNNWIKI